MQVIALLAERRIQLTLNINHISDEQVATITPACNEIMDKVVRFAQAVLHDYDLPYPVALVLEDDRS